jgi:hypothetical protein
MTETVDSLGNVVSRTGNTSHDFPNGGGIPASAVPKQHRISPELVADLDDREKALGSRYMREDGKRFEAEIRDAQKRNNLDARQAARRVMEQRQRDEKVPADRELVVALQNPNQRKEIMRRIEHGLPAFPENK